MYFRVGGGRWRSVLQTWSVGCGCGYSKGKWREGSGRVCVWVMGLFSFCIVHGASFFSQPWEKCRNFRPKEWAVWAQWDKNSFADDAEQVGVSCVWAVPVSICWEDSCSAKLTSPVNCRVSGLQWASTGRTWNTMCCPRSQRRWQWIAWNGLENTIPVSTEQHCVLAGVFVSYFLRQEKLL